MKPEGISEDEWSALNRAEGPAPAPANFPTLQHVLSGGDPATIGLLGHVQLELTVQLGRTKRSIKDVLALAPGAVLELDRLAGEPVDILANGRLVAKGEVLVIGENFGVRVTELISGKEEQP